MRRGDFSNVVSVTGGGSTLGYTTRDVAEHFGLAWQPVTLSTFIRNMEQRMTLRLDHHLGARNHVSLRYTQVPIRGDRGRGDFEVGRDESTPAAPTTAGPGRCC